MDERIEIGLKIALALAALAGLWTGQRPRWSHFAHRLLWAVALLGVAGYLNFGRGHGRTFAHYWEHFHYFLNSKYFAELRHDGLYVASVAAQREALPDRPLYPLLRDLRDNQIKSLDVVDEHLREVRGRFTNARWEQFVEDNRFFVEANDLKYITQIRLDHGFNATPAWTFVARLFSGWLPAQPTVIYLLAWLDLVLLALLFDAIGQAYGRRALLLSLLIFGVGYAGRFFWIGGAFLRLDWLAALGVGICNLKRGRHGTAGALMAYAAASRLFPVLFLFGLGSSALGAWRRGERPAWVRRFAAGFALAFALCLAAGCLVGRGWTAWPEFAQNIAKHHGTWLNNNVGLKNLVLYDRSTIDGTRIDRTATEPWTRWQQHLDERAEDHQWIIRIIQLAGIALLFAAAWRAPPDQAAILSMTAPFVLLLLTCYYWIMLLLAAMHARRKGLTVALLFVNLAALIFHFAAPPLYELRYGFLSWMLAIFFAGWLLLDAAKPPEYRDRADR